MEESIVTAVVLIINHNESGEAPKNPDKSETKEQAEE